jgi:hypothetical protein
MADNGRLTARQEKALLALLTESSIREAATASQVGERTLYAWLKEPVFAEAYRQARKEAVSRALGRLQQVAAAAVDTLHAVTTDTEAPAPARVNAAKIILELAVKAVELEDLEQRLSAVEALSRGQSQS